MAGRFTVEAVFKGVDRVTKPITRMQNSVQKFSRMAVRALKKIGAAAKKVGGFIGRVFKRGFQIAGVAVAAVTVAIVKFTKEADSLAKQSRLLDFDIQKLQEWKFAAGQAGLSTENFDKALEGFLKRTGEARAGTGSMITLLKKQNPELLKNILATEDSAEAFQILVEGIRNTEGAQNKLALANAAGGRSASKLILLAKVQKSELQALFKEQRENGNITNEQAKLAEELTDAWTSMGLALKGFRNDILEPLLPMLIDASKHIRQWAIDNKALIAGKFKAFLKFVVDNFADIVKEAKFFLKVAAWIVGIVLALKALVLILTVINIVMSANPVVLIIFAIIAAIALFIIWIKFLIENWEVFGRFFTMLWDGIVTGISASLQFIKDLWNRTIEDITAGIVAALKLMDDLFDAAKRVLGLSEREDQEKATLTRLQAVNPVAGILANMTDEERARLEADPAARIAFGLPPRSEAKASATVTIKDDTGRAEMTQSSASGAGAGITLQPTGNF